MMNISLLELANVVGGNDQRGAMVPDTDPDPKIIPQVPNPTGQPFPDNSFGGQLGKDNGGVVPNLDPFRGMTEWSGGVQ